MRVFATVEERTWTRAIGGVATALVHGDRVIARSLEDARLTPPVSVGCEICDTPGCGRRHPVRAVRVGADALWLPTSESPRALVADGAWWFPARALDRWAPVDLLPPATADDLRVAWWAEHPLPVSRSTEAASLALLSELVLGSDSWDRATCQRWIRAVADLEVPSEARLLRGPTAEPIYLDLPGTPAWCGLARVESDAAAMVLGPGALWPPLSR